MDIWTKAIPELFKNLKALGCVLAEYQLCSQGTPRAWRCQDGGEPALPGPQRQAGGAGLRKAQGRGVGAAIYVLLKDSDKIYHFSSA